MVVYERAIDPDVRRPATKKIHSGLTTDLSLVNTLNTVVCCAVLHRAMLCHAVCLTSLSCSVGA